MNKKKTLSKPGIEHYKERFKPSLAGGARYDLIVGPSTMSCHSSAVPTEIEHYKERFKPSLAAGARYDLIVGPSTMSCHSSAVPTEIEHYKERFKPCLAAGARYDLIVGPYTMSCHSSAVPTEIDGMLWPFLGKMSRSEESWGFFLFLREGWMRGGGIGELKGKHQENI